jgi:hypothetical protein
MGVGAGKRAGDTQENTHKIRQDKHRKKTHEKHWKSQEEHAGNKTQA